MKHRLDDVRPDIISLLPIGCSISHVDGSGTGAGMVLLGFLILVIAAARRRQV